jgi:hypothetical protein
MGSIGGNFFAILILAHIPFNGNEKVGWGRANIQDDFTLFEIGYVEIIFDELLLMAVETVKRRGLKVKGIRHSLFYLLGGLLGRRGVPKMLLILI